MTSPRLYLHVGDRKTGTTTIQHVLDKRARTPARFDGSFGIFYPKSGRNNETRYNHVNLAHELLGDRRFNTALGGWSDLARELEQARPPLTVISSEGFESVPPEVVQKALADHVPKGTEITLVAYIRPHADRILASYAQNVKTGKYTLPLDTFARRSMRGRLGALHKRAAAWRAVFTDRYHVRPYVRDLLIDRDVVADFLMGQVGLGPETMQNLPPVPDENPAPGVYVTEILRQLTGSLGASGTPLPPVTNQKVLKPLRSRLMALYPDDPKLRFTPDQAKACIAACLKDAQAMDRDFCGGATIFEDALHAAEQKAGEAPPPLSSHDVELHMAYANALVSTLNMRVEQE